MKVEDRIFSKLKSPYDIRDYKLAYVSSPEEFPDTFELATVTIKDQGSIGSCVAHACSSIVEFHNNRQQKNPTVFSTEFIYGYRPEGYYIGEGMYPREALKTLKNLGDCPLNDLPGNNKCNIAMENVNKNIDDLKKLAAPHKISSFAKLSTNDEIKQSLISNGYVLVSMPWHKDYRLNKGIYTYKSSEIRGYHAVIIYGWNKDGWLVQNSWGKYWGDKGKFIIPFDFKFTEMWAVSDDITFEDNLIKPEEENIFIKVFSGLLNIIVNIFKKIFKKY